MKKLTMTFIGLVAGALLFIGAQGVSTASEGSTAKTALQMTTTAQGSAFGVHGLLQNPMLQG